MKYVCISVVSINAFECSDIVQSSGGVMVISLVVLDQSGCGPGSRPTPARKFFIIKLTRSQNLVCNELIENLNTKTRHISITTNWRIAYLHSNGG